MLVVDDSDAIHFAFGEVSFLSALGAIGTCSIFVPSCLFRETDVRHNRRPTALRLIEVSGHLDAVSWGVVKHRLNARRRRPSVKLSNEIVSCHFRTHTKLVQLRPKQLNVQTLAGDD